MINQQKTKYCELEYQDDWLSIYLDNKEKKNALMTFKDLVASFHSRCDKSSLISINMWKTYLTQLLWIELTFLEDRKFEQVLVLPSNPWVPIVFRCS